MKKESPEFKIKKWEELLQYLQSTTLPQALQRIGEAGAEGDLRENIAYEEAERKVYRLQDKADEIKQIIKKLEREIKNGPSY